MTARFLTVLLITLFTTLTVLSASMPDAGYGEEPAGSSEGEGDVTATPSEATPLNAEPFHASLENHPGKAILEGRCVQCHQVPAPTDYTLHEWPGIIKRMTREASLREAEAKVLYEYIESVIMSEDELI